MTDASRHSFATVPTNTPGTYQVSYSATDPNSGYVYRQVASVTILPSKTTVNVADQNLIAGPKTTWQPADSFVSATNETGQSVDLADMTVSGADQVDLTTPGQYPVTYAYTDALNNVVQQTAQVNVAATKLIAIAKSLLQCLFPTESSDSISLSINLMCSASFFRLSSLQSKKELSQSACLAEC